MIALDTWRLMQNPAINSAAGSLARLLRKFPTRLTNTKQRLLRPVERRFPRQTFPSRRSRCAEAYVQELDEEQLSELECRVSEAVAVGSRGRTPAPN